MLKIVRTLTIVCPLEVCLYTVKAVSLIVTMSVGTAYLKIEGNRLVYPGYGKMCSHVYTTGMCLSLSQARSSSRHWGRGVTVTFWDALARVPGGALAPPPYSSPLIGRGRYDVVGTADRNLSAGRAGGIVRRPRLCYVFAYLPGRWRALAAAARSGVPAAAAAAAAAMVSPVTVVSERASEPVSGAAGAHRPGDWAAAGQAAGGRGKAGISRCPREGGGRCHGTPRPLRPAALLLHAAPARPLEGGKQWARDSEA